MALFPQLDEDAIFLSMYDASEPLSSFSKHAFFLDEFDWPSVAHYVYAMQFDDPAIAAKIRSAGHPKKARHLARRHWLKRRKDWKKRRSVLMTRAVYIKCRTHQDVADALLATGERELIENNSYDYFWGCGRDRRGQNQFGKVLMNVRARLRREQKEQQEQDT